VLFLIGIVKSFSQVNEVKIHALDVRAAQVRAAKVGFADFLRGFEVLFSIVVRVEASSSSFRSEGASD
jgi:hypothetical protein